MFELVFEISISDSEVWLGRGQSYRVKLEQRADKNTSSRLNIITFKSNVQVQKLSNRSSWSIFSLFARNSTYSIHIELTSINIKMCIYGETCNFY